MDLSKDQELVPTQSRREQGGASSLEKERGLENHALYIDPAVEKRVVRKIDRVLIPLVMGLCE